MNLSNQINEVLIVSIIPYFLERNNLWFDQNIKKIFEARKTQVFWQENTLFLEKDLKIPLSFLLRKLDEMGYEKVWQVSQIGAASL
jgi:transcription-repair coupling factor (superfamily II helicase)